MAIKSIQHERHTFDISYEILNPEAKIDIIILHGWGSNKNIMKNSFSPYMDRFRHIYLDYFGTQAAIAFYKIPSTRINGQQAQQIREGYLVVSASQLVRPEWAWLRAAHQPVASVAYTTFVYRFP